MSDKMVFIIFAVFVLLVAVLAFVQPIKIPPTPLIGSYNNLIMLPN